MNADERIPSDRFRSNFFFYRRRTFSNLTTLSLYVGVNEVYMGTLHSIFILRSLSGFFEGLECFAPPALATISIAFGVAGMKHVTCDGLFKSVGMQWAAMIYFIQFKRSIKTVQFGLRLQGPTTQDFADNGIAARVTNSLWRPWTEALTNRIRSQLPPCLGVWCSIVLTGLY